MATPQLVFVIGAARSGTTMLSKLIENNLQVQLVSEINSFWRTFIPDLRYDAIASPQVTAKIVSRAREQYLRTVWDGSSSVLVEKSATNCLRMPLLTKVFPDALFVHIIRDGRDVAISARKKVMGDIRKITKVSDDSNATSFSVRMKALFSQAVHQLSYARNPLRLLRSLPRYLAMAATVMGLRKNKMWGPRFVGCDRIVKQLPQIAYGAAQWRACVEPVLSLRSQIPQAQYFQIHYEDLLSSPEKSLCSLFEFLGNPIKTPKHDLVPGAELWRDRLLPKEIMEVSEQIEWLVTSLDYPPSFDGTK